MKDFSKRKLTFTTAAVTKASLKNKTKTFASCDYAMLDALCKIGETLSELIGRTGFDVHSKTDNKRVVNVAHFSWQLSRITMFRILESRKIFAR